MRGKEVSLTLLRFQQVPPTDPVSVEALLFPAPLLSFRNGHFYTLCLVVQLLLGLFWGQYDFPENRSDNVTSQTQRVTSHLCYNVKTVALPT